MAARQWRWQTQHRETYDRGNGATLLPYNLAQRTVMLVRQFRYPAYVNGHDDLLIEAVAGCSTMNPGGPIRAEAEEETGYRLGEIRKVFEAFMSPGSITEKSTSSSRNTSPACGSARRRHRLRRRGHRGAGTADR